MLVGVACTLPAAGRTWTSVSGSTLEAEFAGLDGSFVILERSNGARLKIDFSNLSEVDRAYVREETGVSPEPEQQQPEPSSATRKAGPALPGGMTFPDCDPVPILDLPAIELRNPGTATYWSLQFGPGPDDVAFFIFDQPDPDSLHDMLYVYSPGALPYQDPQQIVGKRIRKENRRIQRFQGIQFAARNGEIDTQFDLEFLYGVERDNLIALQTDVTLTGAAGESRLRYGRYINEEMTLARGSVQPFPALAPITLTATGSNKYYRYNVRIALKVGSSYAVPGKGADRFVRAEFVDANGKVVERVRCEPDEAELLAQSHVNSGLTPVNGLRPGQTYQLRASIDLGGVIGTLETAARYTTTEKR